MQFSNAWPLLPSAWQAHLGRMVDRFVPVAGGADVEVRRRSQLFISFSVLGWIFGGLFAAFYFGIGHPWGGAIVLLCTLAMLAAPWIVRGAGLETAGNVYACVLVLGFSGLTAIEGGLHGHAIAWLAVVPLCTSILVDQKLGRWWSGICLGVVVIFCVLDFEGYTPAPMYPPRWETTITAAGYLSLTVFMSMVGLLFERGRRHALLKLHTALGALSDANDRLQVLDRERSEFLGIAAHDLRSPLNTIMGFAQLLQEFGPSDDELQRDSLRRILSVGGQMTEMLDQLLSLRAIEEGKLEFKLQPCDLNGVAAQVVDGYTKKARSKSLRLTFQPAPGLPLVEADPQALTQVLDNLLSNAIKFSPINRPITVRVLPAEPAPDGRGRATAEVQDAGPGLSEEDQRKLYGKFAKLSARPTAGESSNGLGLSIVKRLAEGMNGQLACRSQLGHGCVFSVTLHLLPPLTGEESRPPLAQAPPPASPAGAPSALHVQ